MHTACTPPRCATVRKAAQAREAEERDHRSGGTDETRWYPLAASCLLGSLVRPRSNNATEERGLTGVCVGVDVVAFVRLTDLVGRVDDGPDGAVRVVAVAAGREDLRLHGQ
jgi:hypothetical protein